jgi:protocatechuate 3,4-dioxygenase alpha subunit
VSRIHTPSQTVGPFFHLGFDRLHRNNLVPHGTPADHQITIHGKVCDAELAPVPDAVLEVWQADAHGEYPSRNLDPREAASAFRGFGRIPTDDAGEFHFTTIKPGAVRDKEPGTLQAPHIVVTIFMRGLLRHLHTRIYFPGDAHNDADPVLHHVLAARRSTLIAQTSSHAPHKFEWNVVLQGENETVFFDL